MLVPILPSTPCCGTALIQLALLVFLMCALALLQVINFYMTLISDRSQQKVGSMLCAAAWQPLFLPSFPLLPFPSSPPPLLSSSPPPYTLLTSSPPFPPHLPLPPSSHPHHPPSGSPTQGLRYEHLLLPQAAQLWLQRSEEVDQEGMSGLMLIGREVVFLWCSGAVS